MATPKLHSLFARAKEAEGRFDEAAASFESAKDYDNVARLCLQQLHTPEKAFALVGQPSRHLTAQAATLSACVVARRQRITG